MKKLLITASILLIIALAFVACDSERPSEDTTIENITIADPTTDPSTDGTSVPSVESEEAASASTDFEDTVTAPDETNDETVTSPEVIPEMATSFSVVFGEIYTEGDKGTLFGDKLSLVKDADSAYFSGVRKNDWIEFSVNAAATGEYEVCMVFGGTEPSGRYTLWVDGCKASTIRNKISGTDEKAPTDSTSATIHLTRGIHKIRVVMDADGPHLYGVKFALIRENLALSKPASANSISDAQFGAVCVNDGDTSTRWSALPQGEAQLIIDLQGLYTLDKIAFLFENSMGEYSISVSKDGENYNLVCNGAALPAASAPFMKEYHLNDAIGRYIKVLLKESEDTVDRLFSIYETYIYGEEFVIPPEPVYYDDYVVPHNKWTVSGHCPSVVGKDGHNLSGMVAAGGVEAGALLHQGAIGIGKIDLSKYDKVIIYYGLDSSGVTQGHYNANAHNRILLTKADTDGVSSPEASDIIASATYTLKGWAVSAIEIDLSNISYNGSVYITYDTLPGTFMLIGGIEFIGAEKK